MVDRRYTPGISPGQVYIKANSSPAALSFQSCLFFKVVVEGSHLGYSKPTGSRTWVELGGGVSTTYQTLTTSHNVYNNSLPIKFYYILSLILIYLQLNITNHSYIFSMFCQSINKYFFQVTTTVLVKISYYWSPDNWFPVVLTLTGVIFVMCLYAVAWCLFRE